MNNSPRKLALSALISATLAISTLQAAPPPVEPGIPSNSGGFYYSIGGGGALPNPPTFANSTNSSLNLEFGFGYSCGRFDPTTDVEEMLTGLLDGVADAARRLPQQLMFALEAAITAMPGYLLNKANPSLYNVLMKAYEDTFELYELSYQSCEAMERDIADGKNPYQNFIQATIADRWRINAGVATSEGGEPMTIDQVDHAIKTGDFAAEGLTLWAGKQYGGAPPQEPIRPNYLTAVVGYNVLLGNGEVDNPAGTGETTEDIEGVPVEVLLPTFWPNAGAAAEWIVNAIGDTEIRLQEGETSGAVGGSGLRAFALEESYEIHEALALAVDENDYSQIRGYKSTLQVSGNLIHAIRVAQPFDRAVMMQRLSSELAADLTHNHAVMAKEILRAGLNEAGIVMSTAAGDVREYIQGTSMPALDAAIRDIHEDLALRSATHARTAKQIMLQAESDLLSGSNASAPSQTNEIPLLDGRVRE